MRAALLTLLLASPALAQPPKAPPVSLPPKAPPVAEASGVVSGPTLSYADVHARVARGGRVVWTGQPPDMAFGTYDCWLENGRPVMELRKEVRSVATSPFRAPAFDGDHRCDACGAYQYVISGYLPGGRHTHTCSRCGNVWQH